MKTLDLSEEIGNRALSATQRTALLSAVILSLGSLSIADGKTSLELCFTDRAQGYKIADLIKRAFGVQVEFSCASSENKKQAKQCYVRVAYPDSLSVLSATGIMQFSGESVSEINRGVPPTGQGVEEFSAFLAGLFFVKGKLYVPHGEDGAEAGYRIEFQQLSEELAQAIADECEKKCYTDAGVELQLKLNLRKEQYSLYCTDFEKICDLAAYMGATDGVLGLQEMQITRQLRNDTNRRLNCDYANIAKSVDAAALQLQAISKLREAGVFDTLDEKLRAVAIVREEQDSATIQELSLILGLSKSGVYHRLDKLIQLAQELTKA